MRIYLYDRIRRAPAAGRRYVSLYCFTGRRRMRNMAASFTPRLRGHSVRGNESTGLVSTTDKTGILTSTETST